MAVNACDICGCIPISMDDRFFYQAAINLLCDISANTGGATASESSIPVSTGVGALKGGAEFPVATLRLATRTITSAGSTTTTLNSTAHGAVVGNIIQFVSGPASPSWSYVSAVPTVDTITLAYPLAAAPANGNSFILSYQAPIAGIGGFAATDTGTALLVGMNTLGGSNSGASNLLKIEDVAHASGDAGVAVFAVRNDALNNFTGTDGDYSPIAVGGRGDVFTTLIYDSAIGSGGPIRLEDSAIGDGAPVMVVGVQRQDTPANNTSTDGDATFAKSNVEGYLYVDTVRRNTMTHTQPTVTTATSFTLAASNAQRKYLRVQNNSAANILLNLNNGTLTGIVPTSTNLGIVLAAGAFFETPPNFCPTAAVTVYQSSGGSINTISVIEGA